jgi:hypothetical protein
MKLNKKLTLLILLITISAYFFMPQKNHTLAAQGLSVSISPAITELRLTTPSTTTAPLSFENHSDEILNVQITFKPFHPSGENGEIEYPNQISEEYKRIFSKIVLTENGIATNALTVAPRQKKDLKLLINIPNNQKQEDYYFSVIFLATHSVHPDKKTTSTPTITNSEIKSLDPSASNQTNYSVLNAGIAANFLLSIGSEHTQGNIEEFSAPTYVQSGPVDFTLRIKNTSKHVYKPQGMILITNMFGQPIARLDIKPENILAGSIRALTSLHNSTTSTQKSITNPPGLIRWNENFLLGPYTAKLTISLSEKGPIYNRTVLFFAFPAYIISIAIVLIIVLIYIIIRIKYYIKYIK